MKLLIT